jgi:hypothetical protein
MPTKSASERDVVGKVMVVQCFKAADINSLRDEKKTEQMIEKICGLVEQKHLHKRLIELKR